ncbi:hypothetical protein [Novosphingobium sp. 9U]|uniref:hypothetical protein n=1 Tax=Novosphingobium sp. 9U TaxID=2653158 RepID=UPI0012F077F5|nr:hypothetical protein [Novosphingobium sp. 9U]VWX51028.1 hypothetical protein NOVOSPHI9U_370032 [Novosphingobium sp. 9U]
MPVANEKTQPILAELRPLVSPLVAEHLQIDTVHAYLCADVFGKPESYYDGHCTFMTALMPEIAHHLDEAGPALSGDFGSLKSNLCKSLARRLVQDVIKHNQVVEQAPRTAFE